MVKRKDQQRTLKEIMTVIHDESTSGNTTPYGQVMIEAGEGTTYQLDDGSTLYVDGVEMAAWRSDLAIAKQTIADTDLELDAIEQDLLDMDQEVVSIKGGNIDVPGELAAKVVNAMDINTKRLVVTEDAILNQVTVIEGIVTPELVSQRIVLTDLGQDLMQEAALTVVGPGGTVQLSGSGYQAWNVAGDQTVRLDGMDNVIVGTFRTAFEGSRIRLSKTNNQALIELYGDNSPNRTLMWQSTAGRLNLYSQLDHSQSVSTTKDTGITIDSGTDDIYLNGRLGVSRSIQKGQINWSSFAAGQYMTLQTVTFHMPFKTIPFITCQAQSQNSTDVVITLRSRSTTGFTYNIVNQSSNNATGALRMDWIAIA